MDSARIKRLIKAILAGITLGGLFTGVAACKEALIGGAGAAVGYGVGRAQGPD